MLGGRWWRRVREGGGGGGSGGRWRRWRRWRKVGEGGGGGEHQEVFPSLPRRPRPVIFQVGVYFCVKQSYVAKNILERGNDATREHNQSVINEAEV